MKCIEFILFLLCAKVLFGSADCARIPVCSFPFLSNQKFIQIQIGGKPYLALIDTGAACSFIRKDVLNEITSKNYISNSEYINIYGHKYFTLNFQIPDVKIGNFCINTVFREEHENFLAESIVENNPLISWKVYLMYQVWREGIIGVDIFQKFACIFDFPHSSIFLAKEMSQIIENENFTTAEFHSVQFDLGKAGVILTLETDLGKKRLLLDAGSTISILKLTDEIKAIHENAQEFISNKLVLNGLDFGSWKFRIIDIAREMDDIDGLLGIEFFNKNIICLDFFTKMAYIQTPKLGSKERFTYWMKSYFGK